MQQLRVVELNEIVKDLTQKMDPESANRKLVKLKEDNDSLQNQIQSMQKKKVVTQKSQPLHAAEGEPEEPEEGSFLQGIRIADNLNTSVAQQDNNFFMDQSSLQGVIEGLDGQQDALKKENAELRDKVRQLQTEL